MGDIGPGARASISALVGLLKDPEFKVRRDAARSLGQLDTEATTAVPELERLLQDPNPEVRGTAQKALERLGKGRKGN
jgi:HEAT repeat protein